MPLLFSLGEGQSLEEWRDHPRTQCSKRESSQLREAPAQGGHCKPGEPQECHSGPLFAGSQKMGFSHNVSSWPHFRSETFFEKKVGEQEYYAIDGEKESFQGCALKKKNKTTKVKKQELIGQQQFLEAVFWQAQKELNPRAVHQGLMSIFQIMAQPGGGMMHHHTFASNQ